MPYTVIPLGTQQQMPMQMPYDQLSSITQQPRQYPMVMDLSQAYNNSIQPMPDAGPITPSKYIPTEPAATSYRPAMSNGCCGKSNDDLDYDDGYARKESGFTCCGACCGEEEYVQDLNEPNWDQSTKDRNYGKQQEGRGYQGNYASQPNQRTVFTAVPSSSCVPVQLTRPTMMPVSYPQRNVQVIGNVGRPMYTGPIDKRFSYGVSNVQPIRYVMK